MQCATLMVLMQISLVGAAPQDASKYSEAYHDSAASGKPLLILVGADWCPACQTMKGSVLPTVRERGDLDRVAFARVDADSESGLARQLMSGGSIPQLIMYSKVADGWKRDQLTGAQSPESVRSFIAQGLPQAKNTMQTTGTRK